MDKNKDNDKSREEKTDMKRKESEEMLIKGKEGTASDNMGNDISGDIKVANSHGELEGGDDKTWHLNEGK